MIDFKNAGLIKLKPVPATNFQQYVNPLLIGNEQIIGTFQGIRDGVVFTNKRIIAINVQGLTGKKRDFTSMPYKRIQAYSVETAGVLDLDSELELWFSGLGMVKFEFSGGTDITAICRAISEFVLD